MRAGRAVLVLLAATLVACPAQAPDPTPKPSPSAGTPSLAPGGTLRFGVLGDPATLDPYSGLSSDLTFALVRPLYPSLFRMRPDGSTEPYLARGLEVKGGRTRVHLAEMAWSNGQPITARDVVATIRRAQAPSGLAGLRARAVDGEVELRGAAGPERLAVRAPILPAGKVTPGVYGGPFVLAERTPGLKLVYTPNPEWSGDSPLLERLVVEHIATVDIMLSLLQDGRLDAAAVPSTVNLSQRVDAMGLHSQSAVGWGSVRFETHGLAAGERAGLTDAVDRGALAEGLIRSDGEQTNTLWPGTGGPVQELGGGAPPTRISLAVPEGDELLYLLQRALQIQWADHSIAMDLIEIDPRTLYGPWRDEPGAEVLLLRVAGDPLGAALEPGAADTGLPLFRVSDYLVWRDGASGLEIHPSAEGPLWNAENWSIKR